MILSSYICQNTVKAWQLVGVLILVLKIIVPLVIIITAVVPIFNALIKGTEAEMKSSMMIIGKKLAAGILVFMVPSLIASSIKMFVGDSYKTDDIANCVDCFSDPNGSACKTHVDKYNNVDVEESEEYKKRKEEEEKINGGSVDTDDMTGSTSPSN